jgi:hypothetical protein
MSLAFLESANFEETATVGGFTAANNENSFDNVFAEAVADLERAKINYFMDIATMVKNPDIMEAFKESALSGLRAESAERSDSDVWGSYSNMYDQVSQLWDNCTTDFVRESATVGQLMPIKAIDYPILVKQHLSLATKDILQTEVTKSPVIKKQMEQVWIVDNQTKQRWRYPQCFYNDEYKDIYEAGKGLPIKNTPVDLPVFNYDIIGKLTDAVVPEREKFTINLKIVKAITTDGIEIPVDMYINLHTSQWIGGKIDVTVQNADGEPVEIQDAITGDVDFISNTVSLSSAAGKIKSVVFDGYLSNEKNERSVSFDYTREEKEWKIEDSHRVNIPYSIEELDDHKALLNMDLYKKTYDNMAEYLTQMEDSKIIDFLDDQFEYFAGLELDPLQWNSFVRFQDFNCDSSTQTTALPSEFIEKQLKWTIDRFVIDLTNTAKMEDLTFVIYGNPKYVSLLGKNVNWVLSQGSSTGGIKHNYAYGVMNTGNVKIQVVSALKFDERRPNHRGLRIVPIALDPQQMTFKHYKYNTHILTAKDSAYKAPDLPGGSYTNLVGLSRYTDAAVQGIQGQITFSNAEFIDSTFIRKE